MLTVEGVFRNGHVELLEEVRDIAESKVLVTFVDDLGVDLAALGIDEDAAVELRAKFDTFDDWNDPAMDIYNNYDDARPS